jgi:hypothetical protein
MVFSSIPSFHRKQVPVADLAVGLELGGGAVGHADHLAGPAAADLVEELGAGESAEGDDEGGESPAEGYESVEGAAEGAGGETGQGGGWEGPMTLGQGNPDDGAGEGEHGADREIDLTEEEDVRHAGGDQQGGRDLVGDGAEVGGAEEVAGGEAEDEHQDTEGEERAEMLAGPAGGRRQAAGRYRVGCGAVHGLATGDR